MIVGVIIVWVVLLWKGLDGDHYCEKVWEVMCVGMGIVKCMKVMVRTMRNGNTVLGLGSVGFEVQRK